MPVWFFGLHLHFVVPCNKFPNISLTFGSKSFPVPFSDLNLGKVSNRSEDCVSGIAGVNLGFREFSCPSSHNRAQADHRTHSLYFSAFWIVGDVFLRNVYTMFDLKHSVVGFADLA